MSTLGPMATLRVLSGPMAGRERAFSDPLVVGRSGTDFDIADPEISRRHLTLTPRPGGVEVADLGSANGTWIDQKRLSEPVVLAAATPLRAGQTTFEVVPET
jgi:pSer/pThr/pTyr-binding forkhead associated (FHA) protein